MSTEMKNKLANPGPLGLLGFGMTTVLLNLHNAGLLPLSIVIVAMGIALGGLAQIIAGIRELCQGNTFAGTAFTAYGLFWWSLVLIWVNPFTGAGIEAASKVAMGYYLLLWGIFTFFMFSGTLKHNRATQVVFGSLTVLFILLALGDFTLATTHRARVDYIALSNEISHFLGEETVEISSVHKDTSFLI